MDAPTAAFELEVFGASPERGFLPSPDPQIELPLRYALLHELAAELPRRLLTGRVRSAIEGLPVFDMREISSDTGRRCAMRVLSYLAHAYVWGENPPATQLPVSIARPWQDVSRGLGRPPVLSYASYCLDNWRRIDREGPVEIANLQILQNFLGGADEDWFILIHVEIEALAGPILAAVEPIWRAVEKTDIESLVPTLERVAVALERIVATLRRMPEHCDPYVYYRRVRPFIHGWKDHPSLPVGLLYEGVDEFAGEPQRFRGETGAQSSVVPTLDALLGVGHGPDPLRVYLDEMRTYMPPGHRAFVEAVESGPSLRAFVQAAGTPELCEAYDACIHWLATFRGIHLEYAGRYIHSQAPANAANPTQVGTGGTPFMEYLAKHRDETTTHRLAPRGH